MASERVYHGSTVRGLTELRPHANPDSNLDYACVYLTTNRALAAVYIWNRAYKWMNFHVGEDGVPVYTESFPDALRFFYGGVRGCIYTCEGTFDGDENVRVPTARISRRPVRVTAAEEVPDAHALLLAHERAGTLRVRRYEALTAEQLAAERRMILRVIRERRLWEAASPMAAFVAERFPEMWAEGGAC